MIKSIVRVAPTISGKEEVVVLPVFEGEKRLTGVARKLDVLCRSLVSRSIDRGYFRARAGETMLLALQMPKAPDHVILLGLGRRTRLDAAGMAAAGGEASRVVGRHRFKSCHILLTREDGRLDPFLHAFVKGFVLAQYRFFLGGKKKTAAIRRLALMTGAGKAVAAQIRSARVVSEHALEVRDLVNLPANLLTPAKLADEARSLSRAHGLRCRVMGPRDLEKMKMGAILAVAKGSPLEPRLITVHHKPRRSARLRVCLVGKAVTFDSGGISIKPWQHMNEMKGDMAGGALVLHATAAAARADLPIDIMAIVPSVENMVDGISFRPGDVITSYTGKTIEVLSTDAEGRLILSDALAYAAEQSPDVIVDFATLTGAVSIALGNRIAGVMGNDQKTIDRMVAAGRAAGEPVWQLPLDDAFSRAVRGDISDYKNYSGRDGSTITAAALLGEFVGKAPWVHVDIAGTFWSDGGRAPYTTKGATGYGVDLALAFLRSLAEG